MKYFPRIYRITDIYIYIYGENIETKKVDYVIPETIREINVL